MKKLLILLGAALAIGFVHAASVSWNSGAFAEGFKGPGSTTLAKSTAYTIVVSFYSDAVGADLITTSEQTTAKPNGAYSGNTEDVFGSGKTYYVSALIKANDGSASWKADIASFTMGDNGDAKINFTTGSGFDTVSQKWASGGWETGGSVPEPTSGLLMLVGLAGLALRRKCA